MRIISHKKIIDFSKINKNSAKALEDWYGIVIRCEFKSFSELKDTFSSADNVGNLTVFNIGGNKFRLIAAIHYNTQIIYFRHILTHDEYDKEKWKK